MKHFYDAGKVDLQYCPMEQMWADVLTKPRQGSEFRKMRAVFMNCPIDYSEESPFVPSEPVVPSPVKTDHLMKPRICKIVTSPRECVEVSPPSSRSVHEGVPIVPKDPPPTHKKVTWNNSTSPTCFKNSAPIDLF